MHYLPVWGGFPVPIAASLAHAGKSLRLGSLFLGAFLMRGWCSAHGLAIVNPYNLCVI